LAATACPVSATGDVNGDRAVDICDVQTLMVLLTEAETPLPVADINGDGSVDVLDFQTLLGYAGGESEAPADAPNWTSAGPPNALPVSPRVQVPGPTLFPMLSSTPSGMSRPQSLVPFGCPAEATHPPTSRYLFHLAPNAPPA
jgi:hypothetical protein